MVIGVAPAGWGFIPSETKLKITAGYLAQQAQAHLSPQHFLSLAAASLQQLVFPEAAPQQVIFGLSALGVGAGVGSANAVKANANITARARMDFMDKLGPGLTGPHSIRHRPHRNP